MPGAEDVDHIVVGEAVVADGGVGVGGLRVEPGLALETDIQPGGRHQCIFTPSRYFLLR